MNSTPGSKLNSEKVDDDKLEVKSEVSPSEFQKQGFESDNETGANATESEAARPTQKSLMNLDEEF